VNLWWYTARAAGLVAWGLAAGSVFWGLFLSSRVLGTTPRAPWLLDLHRFLGTLTALFTGVHVAAIVADTYVHFGWTDVLVPLASDWHPVAVAWGIVAMYLVAAIQVTSWAMTRIPRRLWRAVHLSAFVVFGSATVHALTAGTDNDQPLTQWTAVVMCAMFVFLVLYRVLGPRGERERRRSRGHGAAGGRARPGEVRDPGPAPVRPPGRDLASARSGVARAPGPPSAGPPLRPRGAALPPPGSPRGRATPPYPPPPRGRATPPYPPPPRGVAPPYPPPPRGRATPPHLPPTDGGPAGGADGPPPYRPRRAAPDDTR